MTGDDFALQLEALMVLVRSREAMSPAEVTALVDLGVTIQSITRGLLEAPAHRSKNAERQARYRERRNARRNGNAEGNVTRDVSSNASEPPSSLPAPLPLSPEVVIKAAREGDHEDGTGVTPDRNARNAYDQRILCPADLDLTEAQRATLEMSIGMPGWAVDQVRAGWVTGELGESDKRMTLEQWRKCLSHVCSSKWSNPATRPERGERRNGKPPGLVDHEAVSAEELRRRARARRESKGPVSVAAVVGALRPARSGES